jgi:predicted unusual protein kinase regulating ubiquinone biosynthesis (AarF/ABC1/UbiB family)
VNPHPGNVFFTDDGRIALLDLGMVGHTTPRMQENLLKLLLAISEGNSDGAADVVIQFSEKTEEFNQTEFRRGIGQIMASQQDQSLRQTNVGKSLLEVSRNAADNGLFVPSELTLLEMKEFVGGLPSRLDRIMDAIINYLAIPTRPFSAFYPRRREGSG